MIMFTASEFLRPEKGLHWSMGWRRRPVIFAIAQKNWSCEPRPWAHQLVHAYSTRCRIAWIMIGSHIIAKHLIHPLFWINNLLRNLENICSCSITFATLLVLLQKTHIFLGIALVSPVDQLHSLNSCSYFHARYRTYFQWCSGATQASPIRKQQWISSEGLTSPR